MSFLDQVPLNFTDPKVYELRDLFVAAYLDPAEARQLAYSAGLVLGMFPIYDNMRLIWSEVIRRMSNQGKLRDLVEKDRDDPANDGFQQRFGEMLSANPPVQPSKPARPSSWWQGDDQDKAVATKLYLQRLMKKRSQLLHVEVARRLVELAPSVAKLNMIFEQGRGYGTAFLIQPDRLLTDHHNFYDLDNGALLSVEADFDDELGKAVNDHLVVPGKIDSIQGHNDFDWAVITLEHPVARAPIPLGWQFQIAKDDTVIIIQHPLGGPKRFALDVMGVRFADDQIVQYVADTQKGSSGSPVFNSELQVVALHQGEEEATVTVNGKNEAVWRNQGIRISQVMSALQAASISFQAR